MRAADNSLNVEHEQALPCVEGLLSGPTCPHHILHCVEWPKVLHCVCCKINNPAARSAKRLPLRLIRGVHYKEVKLLLSLWQRTDELRKDLPEHTLANRTKRQKDRCVYENHLTSREQRSPREWGWGDGSWSNHEQSSS